MQACPAAVAVGEASAVMKALLTPCVSCGRTLSGGRDTFGPVNSPMCLECRIASDLGRQEAIDKLERDLTHYRKELYATNQEIADLKDTREGIEADIEQIQKKLLALRGKPAPYPVKTQEPLPL
jgi:hypothetical protein